MSEPVGRFSIIPSRAVLDSDLPRPALLLLNALGIYGDKDGWCWPSQGTLAVLTGHSQQWVSKYLLVLEKRDYVTVNRERDPKTGNWKGNRYQIRFDSHTTPEVVRHTTPGSSTAKPPLEVVKKDLTEKAPMNAPLVEATIEMESHWDALSRIFGPPTKGQESLQGRLVVAAKAWPVSEIDRRAGLYPPSLPGMKFTLAAFEKHWEWLASPAGELARLSESTLSGFQDEAKRQERRLEAAQKDALEL